MNIRICLLVSAIVLLGTVEATNACGPGGRPNYNVNNNPYPAYPPRYTPPYPGPYAPSGPVTANIAKSTAPVAPSANLTVVDSAPSSSFKNAILTPGSLPTATVREVPAAETSDEAEATTTPEPPATATVEKEPAVEKTTEKIAEAIKGLVGTWLAVARKDGKLTTVELQLDDRGWAKLTVPGSDGKPSTTTRKVEFENEELKLIGSGSDVTLGKLVEFDSRQMVLDREGGQVTFVRH
jgi:hypothetical protein